MLHVAFDGFDEIRDQVVTAGQLHVDLREGILDPVALVDQPVVYADCPEDDCSDNRDEYQERDHWPAPHSSDGSLQHNRDTR